MAKANENKSQSEQAGQPEQKEKPSVKDTIVAQIEAANLKKQKLLEEAAKAEKEAETVEELRKAVDNPDVVELVNSLQDYDTKMAEITDEMAEKIDPYQKEIDLIKKETTDLIEPLNQERATLYKQLEEKVGEAGAKMLVAPSGVTVKSGKRAAAVGSSDVSRGEKRTKILEAVCDKGLSYADAAQALGIYGTREKCNGGDQENGYLVKRHVKLAAKDGLCEEYEPGKWRRK